eukprot:scaffold15902_cov106-Isochrysis_galbana.AAC.4
MPSIDAYEPSLAPRLRNVSLTAVYPLDLRASGFPRSRSWKAMRCPRSASSSGSKTPEGFTMRGLERGASVS